MKYHLTVNKIRNFIENGKTEAALTLLLSLTKSNTDFSNFIDETILVKNRMETLKYQDAVGMIGFSEKNIEWARISNAIMSIVAEIETQIGVVPFTENEILEQVEPISSPAIQPTKPNPFLPLSRVSLFSIASVLGLVAICSIIYFYKLPKSEPTKPLVFNVAIEAYTDDKKTVYTEGGTVHLQFKGLSQKTLVLNTFGKAFLNDLPIEAMGKTAMLQLGDTSNYTIIGQESAAVNDLLTLKLIVQAKTIRFVGKIINSDGQSVQNAVIEFGSGIAKAQTDASGNYTVNLPKTIGEKVDITIRKDGKILIHEKVLVNEKVLALLKVL